MRVLWLTPYPIDLIRSELAIKKEIGGHPASWIVNLSNELKDNNQIELHILTLSAKINGDKEFVKDNINFHVLKHNFPFRAKGYPNILPLDAVFNYVQIKYRIAKYISAIKPDLIHIQGTEGAYPSLVQITEIPVIISIQGIISKYYEIAPSLQWYFQKKIEIHGIKNCKNFGCRTNWDKAFVKNLNPEANVFYLPEAINYTFFKQQWKLQPDNNKLLFVGSLLKRKGIQTLLKAVSLLEQKNVSVSLNVVGGNLERADEQFKCFFNKLNIENRVVFSGRKNPFEIAKMLSESAIYVHPSFMDNSPNSIAEAMAVGTPCIASNAGGIPSMIEDEKTGLLFETGNESDLANKIEILLLNSELQKEISNNARLVAKKINYPPVVADTTLKVYHKIIGY